MCVCVWYIGLTCTYLKQLSSPASLIYASSPFRYTLPAYMGSENDYFDIAKWFNVQME